MKRKDYVMKVKGGYIKVIGSTGNKIEVVKDIEKAYRFTEGNFDQKLIEKFAAKHNIENYEMIQVDDAEVIDLFI